MVSYLVTFSCIVLVGVVALCLSTVGGPTRAMRCSTMLVLAAVVAALAVTAYYLQPVVSIYVDYQRVVNEVRQITSGNFSAVRKAYSPNVLTPYFLAIGAKFHNPDLIKSLSAILMYAPLMFIPYSEWKMGRIHRSTFVILEAFVLLFVNGPGLITGVRQGPAFAIATLGAYLVLVRREKIIGYILLVAAFLFHFSAVIVLAGVIFTYFKNETFKKVVYMLVLLYTVLSYIAGFVLSLSNIGALKNIFSKMNDYYVFGRTFHMFASGFSQFTQILVVLSSVCVFAISSLCKKHWGEAMGNYRVFYTVILCFCVGSILTSTPLRRFALLSWFLILPILGTVLERYFGKRAQIDLLPEISRNEGMAVQIGMVFFFAVVALCIYSNYAGFGNYYLSAKQAFNL